MEKQKKLLDDRQEEIRRFSGKLEGIDALYVL